MSHDDGEGEVVRVDFGARSDTSPRSEPATAEEIQQGEAKLEMFEAMIDRGKVMVTLDARRDGVQVPMHLREEFQLHLNFSHRFGIPDFAYDEHGVRASLSFGGDDFFCDVPWSAVWMMRSHADGELVIGPESVPKEVQAALAQASLELASAEQTDAPDPSSSSSESTFESKASEARAAKAKVRPLSAVAEVQPDEATVDMRVAPAAQTSVQADDDQDDDEPDPPTRGGLRLVKS